MSRGACAKERRFVGATAEGAADPLAVSALALRPWTHDRSVRGCTVLRGKGE